MYTREIESSVHMRLYTLTKRQFVFLFAFFFATYGITLCIGLLGPPIIHSSSHSTNSSIDETTNEPQISPFHLRSPAFSIFHQQLWLTAKIYRKSKSVDAKVSLDFQLLVNIKEISTKSFNTKSVSESEDKKYNRSRTLQCNVNNCEEILIAHIGFMDAIFYLITVQFLGIHSAELNLLDMKNIVFTFKSFNPTFTQLEIWFRFTYLVIVFIATCLFSHSLRSFRVRDWSIEQKWLSVLLPLLLLYNNPLLPLNFLISGWIPNLIDTFFQATFLCALLLFWLCIYHGVRQNERHWKTFYIPKFIIVGTLWIAAVTLSGWQHVHESQDPTYYYRLDSKSFLIFKIFFLSCGGIYVLYLLYLLIRAFAELHNMPYFNLRLKFLTILTSGVIFLSLFFTALRFGVNVLSDNFISEVSTKYNNSLEFCGIFGLLNLYLLTMAFVYSPSKNARMESHFKDNPTISMLNDSDEDVVYGSDYEETALMSESRKN